MVSRLSIDLNDPYFLTSFTSTLPTVASRYDSNSYQLTEILRGLIIFRQEFYHPPGPTMSAPLPACQPESPTLIRVGYGSVEDWPFRFGPLPEGIESDTGYLKLFVSTKYVDLHELDQAPFDYGRLPAGRVRRPVIDDWDALLASITVSRKL